MTDTISITGIIGRCGDREVFLSFSQASLLSRISFPDVLDEQTGQGYQRRFFREHSLEFKRYIQRPGATTIPLTFNLRNNTKAHWEIEHHSGNMATLKIQGDAPAVMAQVDCQHRLGYLSDATIDFAFMSFIGLSIQEEMEIFRVINGKAKGLNSSLLDFTEARLIEQDLTKVKPELYVALRLQEDPRSPWYQKLDLGGKATVGAQRCASLRTMQKAVKRFFKESGNTLPDSPDEVVSIVISFWQAVATVLPAQWSRPREHMLTKGIGVYSLMSMAGELVKSADANNRRCDIDYFISKLSDFIEQIDWSNQGPLKGFGGASGADAALAMLRAVHSGSISKVKRYGQQENIVN